MSELAGVRPGAAIAILEAVTMPMPVLAAVRLSPTFSPSAVSSMIPFWSSSRRISGMFTQLAAATAQKGTRRPTSGGRFLVTELRPRAAVSAAVVAAQ